MGHVAQRNLREQVTHWKFSGSDEFGTILVEAPRLLKGRWQDEAILMQDTMADLQGARDMVYLSEAVSIGDYIARGDQTTIRDPSDLTDAFRVQRTRRCTDIRNLNVEHVAYV